MFDVGIFQKCCFKRKFNNLTLKHFIVASIYDKHVICQLMCFIKCTLFFLLCKRFTFEYFNLKYVSLYQSIKKIVFTFYWHQNDNHTLFSFDGWLIVNVKHGFLIILNDLLFSDVKRNKQQRLKVQLNLNMVDTWSSLLRSSLDFKILNHVTKQVHILVNF